MARWYDWPEDWFPKEGPLPQTVGLRPGVAVTQRSSPTRRCTRCLLVFSSVC